MNSELKKAMFSKWVSIGFLYLLLVLLSFGEFCNGGITSNYVRRNDLSADMPLDSDVFRVPPGYNAPQQVCNHGSSSASFNNLLISSKFVCGCVLGWNPYALFCLVAEKTQDKQMNVKSESYFLSSVRWKYPKSPSVLITDFY